jgi:RES domain-containing protein
MASDRIPDQISERIPDRVSDRTSDRMKVWRLCRARHAADAFSGEGARRFGGRWNSRGVPMVYTSTSLALAAIELFVHLEPSQAPGDLVAVSATLPQGEPSRTVEPSDLPADWRAGESEPRHIGDEWIQSRASLALRVPSVPIPPDWNVLINPLHPLMTELKIDAPEPFIFDARMFLKRT